MNNSESAKRLAKNTVFMYVRMILLLSITLYTSRVIISALGIDDYGIFNVVGSIVVMFNSLRAIFASSIQRFLSYEMGKGNDDKLLVIYNTSIRINAIVAVVLFFLAEALGLWFLNTHINIEPNRLFAAHVVLQISIIIAMIGVFTTSFDAVVIAHERMDFYAYLSILEAILKLIVAFAVTYIVADKLIAYGALLLVTSCIIIIVDYVFCRSQFKEIRFAKVWDKDVFKEMTKFAGWNFFGNTAFSFSQNGLNMVLNVFGGPAVNAARGIAVQINAALSQVLSNIAIVIKPFCIKTFAEGNLERTYQIVYLSSKLYFTVQLTIAAFFSFFASELVNLWLGQIPQYVIGFVTIILWHSCVRSLHDPIDILFYAYGDLKYYQLCEGIVLSLPVLAAYILLSLDFSFNTVFVGVVIFEIINLFCILQIAQKKCSLPFRYYSIHVLVPCAISFILYIAGFFLFHNESSILIKLLMLIVTWGVCAISMWLVGFNKEEKEILFSTIKQLHHKK